MNCYQHKGRIKFIKINPNCGPDENAERFCIFLQSILFNFPSIRELHLDLDRFNIEEDFNSELTLVSSDLSNLEVLTITCASDCMLSGVSS